MWQQLSDDLRYFYDLDLLFAGNDHGVLTWVVGAASEYYWGPVLGPLFEESVLTTWSEIDPTQYVPPIA